jgi:pimeloyl-ACP methyl ester carboxylesterase
MEDIWRKYLGENSFDFSDSLLVSMPLYVFSGKKDRIGFWQETEKYMQTKHSTNQSEIYLFENSGHFPYIEETDKFFTLLKELLGKEK